MKIPCFWEHNRGDTLLYAVDLPGAYARGESLPAAIAKMTAEIKSYLAWKGDPVPDLIEIVIAEEKESELDIRDADSDAIFDSEKAPLTREEYEVLKALALRSAKDFLALYESIPDKDAGLSPIRKTFYGQVPSTAREMYAHTKSVNAYYFGEIGIEADNPSRKRGWLRFYFTIRINGEKFGHCPSKAAQMIPYCVDVVSNIIYFVQYAIFFVIVRGDFDRWGEARRPLPNKHVSAFG